MKFLLSVFCSLLCYFSYSQSLMTPKEAFFYGLSATGQNAGDKLSYQGFVGSSGKTYQWGDFYASYFDKENYIKAVNDEFKRVPYLTQKFKELNEGIKNADFSKTFYFIVRTGFGIYNTDCGCFPLNRKDFLDYNHTLLDIKEVGNDKLVFDNSFARFRIKSYANFTDFDYVFKIKSSEAEKFIESRKGNSGNISRQITLKVIYNLTKKGNNEISAYIHKIEFYNGTLLLGSTFPKFNYYDKVNLIRIKDGSEKVFLDDKWNELNQKDSMSASYYRIINYNDGKIDNMTHYFISGVLHQKIEYKYSDDGSDQFGKAVSYFEDSQKKAEWGYYNGKFSGQFHSWYFNGKKETDANYMQDNLDGTYTSWYSNGYKKEEVNYVQGKKEGCDYKWKEDGQCDGTSESANGKYSLMVEFFKNGVSVFDMRCPCADTKKEVIAKSANNNSSLPRVLPSKKTDYVDYYNSEFPNSDYKVFDNTVYYKSNNLEIISFSVNDIDGNIITDAKSKVGFPIFLKITVKGLTIKGGKTKFTLSKYEEDTKGTLVSTQTEKGEGGDNPTISIAGGVRMFPNNSMSSMSVHLSFSIKDRNSDSIIHGFFDYAAVK